VPQPISRDKRQGRLLFTKGTSSAMPESRKKRSHRLGEKISLGGSLEVRRFVI